MYIFKQVNKFFPENWTKWKLYLKYSLPVILSALIFSLNNFIDNFMVTKIEQGITSLSYANSWTGIISGIAMAISFVGYILAGHYIGAKKDKEVREVMSLRFLLTFIFTIIIAIFVWFFSRDFILVFAGKAVSNSFQSIEIFNHTIDQGARYLIIISFAWILLTWTTPYSSLLNETGNGKYGFYSSLFSLLINAILNYILIWVFNMGVEAAAFASLAARLFGIFGDTYFVYKKCPQYLINPFKSYKVSKKIWKHFIKRSPGSFLFFSITFLIIFRSVFFNKAYPQGSVGQVEWALSSALIFGFTNAISEMILASFSAVGSNVTLFVSQELGRKNIEQAKKNANEIKGFHFITSFFFSLILLVIILFIPVFRNFFTSSIGSHITDDAVRETVKDYYIHQLQIMLLITVAMNPIWMWFVTTARLLASGGRANLSSFTEFICEIWMMIWALITCFVLAPTFNLSLFNASLIFFAGDFVKLVVYEIVYYKANWITNIENYKSSKKFLSTDNQI